MGISGPAGDAKKITDLYFGSAFLRSAFVGTGQLGSGR